MHASISFCFRNMTSKSTEASYRYLYHALSMPACTTVFVLGTWLPNPPKQWCKSTLYTAIPRTAPHLFGDLSAPSSGCAGVGQAWLARSPQWDARQFADLAWLGLRGVHLAQLPHHLVEGVHVQAHLHCEEGRIIVIIIIMQVFNSAPDKHGTDLGAAPLRSAQMMGQQKII